MIKKQAPCKSFPTLTVSSMKLLLLPPWQRVIIKITHMMMMCHIIGFLSLSKSTLTPGRQREEKLINENSFSWKI